MNTKELEKLDVDGLIAVRDYINELLKSRIGGIKAMLARIDGGNGRQAATPHPMKGKTVAPKYRDPKTSGLNYAVQPGKQSKDFDLTD